MGDQPESRKGEEREVGAEIGVTVPVTELFIKAPGHQSRGFPVGVVDCLVKKHDYSTVCLWVYHGQRVGELGNLGEWNETLPT